MTMLEKIVFLEEIMDVDEGTLSPEMFLDDIEEWDSLSVLTLMAEMKTNFDIILTTKQVNEFKTVEDVCGVIPD